ncbi:hypothetical protein ACIBSV_11030 [Embleya sp. NPDC050154]
MADRKQGTVFTEYGSFYLVPGFEFPQGDWPQFTLSSQVGTVPT